MFRISLAGAIPQVGHPIEESDSHDGKAPYRLVILKQRFQASTVKTIVRNALKCNVLTIVDSDEDEDRMENVFYPHSSS